MAKYVIAVSVDFGSAMDFEGAEKQLENELAGEIAKISFGSVIFDNIDNVKAIKTVCNWEVGK
jgi:hypothetical protein